MSSSSIQLDIYNCIFFDANSRGIVYIILIILIIWDNIILIVNNDKNSDYFKHEIEVL